MINWIEKHAVLWVVLGLVGLALLGIKITSQANEIARIGASSCADVTLLARISADTLNAQIAQSTALLPQISFPGLTHKQLEELAAQKEQKEREHLYDLEAVAHNSCALVR